MEKVLEFVRKNLNVTSSLREESEKIKLSRKLQHFYAMKPFIGIEKSFYERLLSYAASAEKIFPGGGIIFLKKISSFQEDEIDNARNKDELIKKLEILNFEKIVFEMLVQSLELASINTTFLVKKSANNFALLELSEGNKFKVVRLVETQNNIKLDNTKIVCIDGFVENVSEIHHLLVKLSETQDKCIFLCRGMSDDVRHTIKVNLDRKTLNMIPYSIPFDLESCNTLVDIAVVSGCDVLSTNKGELISSIQFDSLRTVEHCECGLDSLVIFNTKTKNSIKSHIKNLKMKLEERNEIESFLNDRIRSLTSSCIEFKLPDDLNYYSRCQQLDEGIRLISSEIKNFSSKKELIDTFLESCTNSSSVSVY